MADSSNPSGSPDSSESVQPDSSSASSTVTAAAESTTGARRSTATSAAVSSSTASGTSARVESSTASQAQQSSTQRADSSSTSRVTSAAAESTTSGSSILRSALLDRDRAEPLPAPLTSGLGSVAAANPNLLTLLTAPSTDDSSSFVPPACGPDPRGTRGRTASPARGRTASPARGRSPGRSSPRIAAAKEKRGSDLGSGSHGSPRHGGKSPRITSPPSELMSRTRIDSHGSELDDSSPDAPDGTEREFVPGEGAASGSGAPTLFSPGQKRSAEDTEEERAAEETFSPTKKFAADPKSKPPAEDERKE